VLTLRPGALDACLLTTIERISDERLAVWEPYTLALARLGPLPHLFPFQMSQPPWLRVDLCKNEEGAEYGDEYKSAYARRMCGGDTTCHARHCEVSWR
jgi:hypothetical protein